MKTTLEYLEDRKNMACHNLLCCSANYIMTKPKEGMEEGFVEYTRDCEIIDELILSTIQTSCRFPQCRDCGHRHFRLRCWCRCRNTRNRNIV